MLRLLIPTGTGYTWIEHSPPAPFPDEFLWADLYEPTTEEERAVEALLTVDVPTRDEMKEIETSNRLYEEGGAIYMTATVGSKLDSDRPESSVITFILTNGRMITNRYVDPTPVRRFMQFVERSPAACTSATTLLAGLVEAFVERIADLLERVQTELDHRVVCDLSRAQARRPPTSDNLHALDPADRRRRRPGLEGARKPGQLPSHADVPAAEREPHAVAGTARPLPVDPERRAIADRPRLVPDSKIQFLLDAVLGLINLQQNNIIKIFSVAAVMFLPPTLVASIYGMNFHHMPELDKPWGYPVALRRDGDLGRAALHLFPPQGLAVAASDRMTPAAFAALTAVVAVAALTPGPAVTAIVARAVSDGSAPAQWPSMQAS